MSRLEIYDINHNYVTTLANAYDVSYEKEENQIWDASFSVAYDDRQRKYLKPLHFVKIFDDDNEYIGEFRIWPAKRKKSLSTRNVQIELLDVLHTLADSVLFGYYQLTNYKTDYVMQWLLNQQKTKRWVMGKCDFSRGFSYSWENENGLVDPLFSIPKPFNEDWVIERDTTVYPWKISLVRPQTAVTCRIIEGYNLKEFTVTEDPQKLVNRVYALGDGEGINQLTFKTINGGKAFVEDLQSQKEHGLIEYIWVDRRFKDKESQKASAEGLLKTWKDVQLTWEISAVDLTKMANRPENLKANKGKKIKANELRLGKVVEVQLLDEEPIQFRILKESKSDSNGNKGDIKLTLGSVKGNSATTQADIERQQEINNTYANGATNIIPYIFDREADAENPVEFKFFIDDDVRNVNTCELTLDTTNFRATSKGNKSIPSQASAATTEGGGAYVSTVTSQGGGASVQSATSSSGGGSVQSATSSSGGGQTSSEGGDHRHLMFTPSSASGPIPTTRYQAYGSSIIEMLGSPNDVYTRGASGSHSHTIANHTHNVSINIPNHTHNVSIAIPAHTHNININIPSHTHRVTITIPSHSHELIFGIFEYQSLPSRLTIQVDGETIPINSTSFERFNIVPYLKKDGDGKVTRGKHTLKIIPNDLARIEVQLILRVFIQSQLGGEF